MILPHDRFKLSTLVHLEGPLTLLLATVAFREMRRSSCSWWGVSALCGYRRLGAAQFYRSCEQIHSAIAPSTDRSVKIMAHIRTGSHTRFVIRGSYSVFNELTPTEGLNYYLCQRKKECFSFLHPIGLTDAAFTTSLQNFLDFFYLFCDILL